MFFAKALSPVREGFLLVFRLFAFIYLTWILHYSKIIYRQLFYFCKLVVFDLDDAKKYVCMEALLFGLVKKAHLFLLEGDFKMADNCRFGQKGNRFNPPFIGFLHSVIE